MGIQNNSAGPSEDPKIVESLQKLSADDKSFSSLSDQESDNEENDALASFEVVQSTAIACDSGDIHAQFECDIQMLSQAIVLYGKSESDKTKAHALLKSILLLYFADISYRDRQDQQFHSWRELNRNSGLEPFPIASVLLHGSRALIEFPSEVNAQIIDWLIINKADWRHAATHGIKSIDEETSKFAENSASKHLQEIKVSLLGAGYQIAAQMLPSAKYQHYGIDVALGGAGNRNPVSQQIIQPNGEHGHLYVYYHVAKEGEHGGLLLGIEQSAPGKSDQYGGSHDPGASAKPYSASGGDFFCKAGALENLAIASYYDSLWNFISNQDFSIIQKSYKTVCVVLDLLSLDPSTKDEGINFIKEIVSSSGQGSKATMDKLCNKYLVKTNLYRLLQEDFNSKLQALEEKSSSLNRSLRTDFHDQLQSLSRSFKEKTKSVTGSLRRLTEENKSLQPQLAQYQSAESQREQHVAREDKVAVMKNLQELTSTFMHNVKNSMGRFSKNSKKEIIFTQLIKKLDGKNANELRENDLLWILKNFIGVAMMNRYDKKGGQTHSGKACLNLLNDPNYKPLKILLFSQSFQTGDLQRPHLLNLLCAVEQPTLLTSARYKQSLYNAFGLSKKGKNIPSEQSDLVMREFVYKC